jgi:transposase-like protein
MALSRISASRLHTCGPLAETGRTIIELTRLSYILIAKTNLIVQMKIPTFKIKDNNDRSKAKTDNKQFVCKECKMSFQSKDSLALHKRKSRHFTGLVYFGKNDR